MCQRFAPVEGFLSDVSRVRMYGEKVVLCIWDCPVSQGPTHTDDISPHDAGIACIWLTLWHVHNWCFT